MGFFARDWARSAKRFVGHGGAAAGGRGAVLVERANETEQRAGAGEENGAMAESPGADAAAASSLKKNKQSSETQNAELRGDYFRKLSRVGRLKTRPEAERRD